MKIISLIKQNYILLTISGINFFLLLAIVYNKHYGYFIDEFYYIACTKHMAFGYVDHPPFSIFVLYLFKFIFGDSLIAIRILTALISSVTIFIYGIIVRTMGGSKTSQAETVIAISFSPIFLIINSFFSMNAIELLIVALILFYLLKIIITEKPKYWIAIGILSGIGLMNKHTLILYLICILAGIVLSKHRKQIISKHFLMSIVMALIIVLPNIIWQYYNGFPSLEFYRNAHIYKNIPTNPIEILILQAIVLNPLNMIIILFVGIIILLKKSSFRFHWFFLSFLFLLIFLFVSQSSRPDRIMAIYPIIIGIALIVFDNIIPHKYNRKFHLTLISCLIVSNIVLMPLAIPVVNPKTYIDYSKYLGFGKLKTEKSKVKNLPQILADKTGWEELVLNIAIEYNKIPPELKNKVVVLCGNYGQAGAVDLLGKNYNLTSAITPQNSYWYWGYDIIKNKEIFIVYGIARKDLEKAFHLVESTGNKFNCKYCFQGGYEFFICRKPRRDLLIMWKEARFFV